MAKDLLLLAASATITAHTVTELAKNLPQANLQKFLHDNPQYKNTKFAQIAKNHTIDLLLGNDVMWSFTDQIEKHSDLNYIIYTDFGCMLTATTAVQHNDSNPFTPHFLTIPQGIENLWQLETLGICPTDLDQAEAEADALQLFYQIVECQ